MKCLRSSFSKAKHTASRLLLKWATWLSNSDSHRSFILKKRTDKFAQDLQGLQVFQYMSKESENIYCIYLELEPYLAQWLLYDNGGITPVRFKKGSIENRILESFLIVMPPNARPDLPTATSLPVAIPSFKHLDPRTYNYLPVSAKKELKYCIRNRFLIQLWNDLHQFGHIGKRRDNLIYTWMDAHGIENTETNFNTITKIYQRQHRAYMARLRRKRESENRPKKR